MKLDVSDIEPREPWYMEHYNLDDYLSLCKKCVKSEIKVNYIPEKLFHEMRYAMQNIKEEEK